MKLARRRFLRLFTGSISLLTAMISLPVKVWADWSKSAFRAKTTSEAMMKLLDSVEATDSERITFKAPTIAENGAVVPVTVKTDLPAVESISIFSEKNLYPLLATFIIPNGTDAFISTRIKLAETTPVIVVVKSEGRLYSARKEIKVTIGGCDG